MFNWHILNGTTNAPAFVSQADDPSSFIFSWMKFFQSLFPLGDNVTYLHQIITLGLSKQFDSLVTYNKVCTKCILQMK